MTKELIEQVARAADEYLGVQCGMKLRRHALDNLAKAAIAAMQPHIAAEREDAARRMQEAAIIAMASERLQDETGDATDISYQCAVEHCSDAIRAIDPAQFRDAGNG